MPDTLTSLEQEAVAIKRRLDELNEKIKSFKSLRDSVWRVKSRSGRRDHYIVISGGNWSCHCDGFLNGRECWAFKGVKRAIENNPSLVSAGVVSFYDENGRNHRSTRVSALV